MKESFVKKITAKIKTKKYRNLDENVILEKLEKVLKQNPKISRKIDSLNERSADFKKILKKIKQEMHETYGAFQQNIGKRENLLKKLKNTNPNSAEYTEIHKKILLTHKSTKERMNIYENLYDDLFRLTGKPDVIVDLACGLNPFSFPWMKIDGMYLAVEFNKKDADFVREYFDILKKTRKGIFETLVLDVTKDYEKLKNLPADVVFAWKLFDITGLKAAENIVKNLNAKYLIVSFSTRTLGNRKMEHPRRVGFERILSKMNLKYEIKKYENELFYVISL